VKAGEKNPVEVKMTDPYYRLYQVK